MLHRYLMPDRGVPVNFGSPFDATPASALGPMTPLGRGRFDHAGERGATQTNAEHALGSSVAPRSG